MWLCSTTFAPKKSFAKFGRMCWSKVLTGAVGRSTDRNLLNPTVAEYSWLRSSMVVVLLCQFPVCAEKLVQEHMSHAPLQLKLVGLIPSGRKPDAATGRIPVLATRKPTPGNLLSTAR